MSRAATTPLKLRNVKDELMALGFDLNTQTNADASVLSILSRLADKGEIRKLTLKDKNGKPFTAFAGPKVKVEGEKR